MAGTAVDTGDQTVGGTSNLEYISTILGDLNILLGKAPSTDPVDPITAAPVSNPDRESTFQLAGFGAGTLALIGVGVLVTIALLK